MDNLAISLAAQTLPDWDKQDLKGHKIDGFRYTSETFFQQEWKKMWTKVWLLMGRESEIPKPGDYQMEEVGPESFIMVRQTDGGIRAFYNVCQHRAARLVYGEIGSSDAFVCPYHGWRWEIDGTLTSVQDPEDFSQGDPCGKLRLKEARCETFAGFIWICMDPESVSLREYLGPVWDDWAAYRIEDWKRYLALTATVPCNWKVILDNFNESYHVNTVHRPPGPRVERQRIHSGVDTNYKTTRFDLSGEGHGRMIMKGGYGGVSMREDGTIGEPLASVLREWELDPADFAGRGGDTRAALQEAKRRLGPARGYTHYENLIDEQLTDAFHYTLFPNFAVSLWSDGFHFLRARPHPRDPEQCIFDNWWYASQPQGVDTPVRTTAGVVDRSAEVEHEIFAAGQKSMGITIDQDMAIMLGQQQGLRSSAYEGAYLAGQESRVCRYHELIDEYLEGRRPQRLTD